MSRGNIITILVGILVLYVAIGWYGNLNDNYEEKVSDNTEHRITYDEAKRILVAPVTSSRKYYYQNTYITSYSRTLIPFKYKKIGTTTKKQYYNTQ